MSDVPRKSFSSAWDAYVAQSAPPAAGWPGDEWGDEQLWSAWFRRLFEPHGVARWRRAIEVGPGAGKYTRRVLDAGAATLLALDVSEKFQEVCRRRLADHVASGRLRLRLVDERDPDALAAAARELGWERTSTPSSRSTRWSTSPSRRSRRSCSRPRRCSRRAAGSSGPSPAARRQAGLDKLVGDVGRVVRGGGEPATAASTGARPTRCARSRSAAATTSSSATSTRSTGATAISCSGSRVRSDGSAPVVKPWRGLSGLPRISYAIALATFINRAGVMVRPFLVLYLTKQVGFSDETAGWMLALYGATTLIAAPLSGWLSDRLGARSVLRGALLIAALALALYPFARTLPQVALATICFSLFNEMPRPALMTLVAEVAPVPLRKQAFVLSRLAINLGLSMGPRSRPPRRLELARRSSWSTPARASRPRYLLLRIRLPDTAAHRAADRLGARRPGRRPGAADLLRGDGAERRHVLPARVVALAGDDARPPALGGDLRLDVHAQHAARRAARGRDQHAAAALVAQAIARAGRAADDDRLRRLVITTGLDRHAGDARGRGHRRRLDLRRDDRDAGDVGLHHRHRAGAAARPLHGDAHAGRSARGSRSGRSSGRRLLYAKGATMLWLAVGAVGLASTLLYACLPRDHHPPSGPAPEEAAAAEAAETVALDAAAP
jgi:hypothetical protein